MRILAALIIASVAALLIATRDRGGDPDHQRAEAAPARAAAAPMSPGGPRLPDPAPPAAGDLTRQDILSMDRVLRELTAPCRDEIPGLDLAPPVNLPYVVTVGIGRAGRARILKVEVEDSTASSEVAQATPDPLRRCLVERLRTQEWQLTDPAEAGVHTYMTALNWDRP